MGLAEIVGHLAVSSVVAVSLGSALQAVPADASSSAPVVEAQCLTSRWISSPAVQVAKLVHGKLGYVAFQLPGDPERGLASTDFYCQQAFGSNYDNVVTVVNARKGTSGSILVSTDEGDELIRIRHDSGPIGESVLLRNLKVWGIDSPPRDYLVVFADRNDNQSVMTFFQFTGNSVAIVAENPVLDRSIKGVKAFGLGYSQLRGGNAVLWWKIAAQLTGKDGTYIATQDVRVDVREVMESPPGTPLFSFIPTEPLGAQFSPLSYALSDAQHTRLSGWVIEKVAPNRSLEGSIASTH